MPSGPRKRKAAKKKKATAMGVHHHSRADSPNQGTGVKEEKAEDHRPMENSGNGGAEGKDEAVVSGGGDVTVEFVLSEKRGALAEEKSGGVVESLEKSGGIAEEEKVISEAEDVSVVELVQPENGDGSGDSNGVELENSIVVAIDGASERLENGRGESEEEGKVAVVTTEDQGIVSEARDVSVELVRAAEASNDGGSIEGEARVIGDLKAVELEKSSEESCVGAVGVAADGDVEILGNGREKSIEEEVALMVVTEENLSKACDASVGLSDSSRLEKSNEENCLESVGVADDKAVEILGIGGEKPIEVTMVESDHSEKEDGGGGSLEDKPVVNGCSRKIELENSEKGNLIEESVHVSEEVNQESKTPPESPEVMIGEVDSASCEMEVKAASLLNETGSPSCDATKAEIGTGTEVSHALPVVHRASLWNCCGLLDVFMGSQR